MRTEFDLEPLLQNDFKEIFNKIDVDSKILEDIDNMVSKYDKILEKLVRNFKYDIAPDLEFVYSFDSYQSSTRIEGEEIGDVEVFNDITQLKSYYSDITTIEEFYYNFNINIKKLNKCVSKKHPGVFRDELKWHVLIGTEKGDLLPADYKNISKYLNQLVRLNLLKGNNVYVEAWIMHCLFEAIHPFSDGNGRVGRFILNNHINQKTNNKTYLDKTILKHKDLYYEALFEFQVKQDFTSSVYKFIELVVYDYEENLKVLERYINNHELLNRLISRDAFLSKYLEEVIVILLTEKVVSKKHAYKVFSKSGKTNKKIMDYLVENNYLAKISDNLYRTCY